MTAAAKIVRIANELWTAPSVRFDRTGDALPIVHPTCVVEDVDSDAVLAGAMDVRATLVEAFDRCDRPSTGKSSTSKTKFGARVHDAARAHGCVDARDYVRGPGGLWRLAREL
jgi:hypothetical protein